MKRDIASSNNAFERTAPGRGRSAAAQRNRQVLNDRRQDLPAAGRTAIPDPAMGGTGGGRATVELAYQKVVDRRRSKPLKLAGLASESVTA